MQSIVLQHNLHVLRSNLQELYCVKYYITCRLPVGVSDCSLYVDNNRSIVHWVLIKMEWYNNGIELM